MPFGVKWKIFFSAKASARLGECKSRGFAERVGRPRGRRGGTERKEEKGGPAAGVEGVYSFVGRVAGYRREGELRNAMSGLVQPAGDASIDLGSDLTPFLRPDHLFRLSSSLVAKPPLPCSWRSPRPREEEATRKCGKTGGGCEGWRWGRHEMGRRGDGGRRGWRTSKSGLPELPPRLRTFTLTSSTSAFSYVRHAAVVLIHSSFNLSWNELENFPR